MKKVRRLRWFVVTILMAAVALFMLPNANAQGPSGVAGNAIQTLPQGQADTKPGAVSVSGAPAAQTAPFNPLDATIRYEIESNNFYTQATALGTLPALIQGNIFTHAGGGGVGILGDADWYSFQNTAAGNTLFAATMTQFTADLASTDSVLTLYAPDGTTVVETDDNDGAFGASASVLAGTTLSQVGTYYLRIIENGNDSVITPYYLFVGIGEGSPTPETEPNDTGQNLPAGGYVSGTMATTTDVDPFFIPGTLNPGDIIVTIVDQDPERDGTSTALQAGAGAFEGFNTTVNDLGSNQPFAEAHFMSVKTAGSYYHLINEPTTGAGTGTYRAKMFVIPGAAPAGQCYDVSTGLIDTPITDNGRITVTLPFTQNITITDVDFTYNISHTNQAHLDTMLISPSNNRNALFTDVGSTGLTFNRGRMDDEAAVPITAYGVGLTDMQPEPQYRLSWFDGEPAQGNWQFVVADDTATATGTLRSATLSVCGVTNPMPTCPVGTQQVTVYSGNFDTTDDGFTHAGTQDEWARGVPVGDPITACHNSSAGCWVTDLLVGYNASSAQELLSPALDLSDPDYVSAWATYYDRYQIESNRFDNYRVQVQTVGGTNQRTLFEHLGGTMQSSGNFGNAQTINHSAGWALRTYDISDRLGSSNSQLRWFVASDSSVQLRGAAVDDVTVYACETIPATATPTATNTATNTPVPPTNTPTSTATNTSVPPTNTPTNTATNTTVPATNTPTATATVTPNGNPLCASPNIPITDNLPAGVTSTINVAQTGTISDLNVQMEVTHSWVGDLIFTLSHGATTAELYDRPGFPATTFGCSGDNFNATADDEGATSFEAACLNATPAFPVGNYIPGDPAGPNLAAFDGQDISGAWTLTASDNASGDTGTLNSWCLVPTTSGPTNTPTATTQATSTATATATATTQATSTATPTTGATATATATPGTGGTYCSTGTVTIPDNLPAGATSVINVADSATIGDLNVSFDVTHSWVGDIAITLSHGATTAELYDRPGVPATTFGCSGDNMDVIADDEAATSFEAACQNATPAFPAGGNFIPGDPAGPNLAAFDGQDINGAWTLTISDNAAGDTGVLNEWCLISGSGGGSTPTPTATVTVSPTPNGNAPDINVDPASVTETHNSPPQTTNRTLAIENLGGATLDWSITEDDSIVMSNQKPYVPSVVGNAPAAQGDNSLGASGQSGAPYRHTLVPQAGSTTVTHSSTQDIETGNSVSCNSGGLHTDNSYYRVFDLAGDFGINDTFTVNEVSFGIEQATGATGSQPVSVILYTLSGPFVLANLTEIGREDVQVADTAGTVETVTFSPAVAVPANSILVAEIFTPNGQTAGNSFFIGSNTAAQTDPSYLRATDCGVSQPTDTAAIGFPNMHIVLNVTGDVGGGGGACTANDIPWLTVSPTNGSTAPGGSTNVTLTFNSTGLVAGTYTGDLCIESNDPDENPVTVPVTLNVGPATAVSLSSLTQAAAGIRIADFAAAGIVVLAGAVLLFRRRK